MKMRPPAVPLVTVDPYFSRYPPLDRQAAPAYRHTDHRRKILLLHGPERAALHGAGRAGGGRP